MCKICDFSTVHLKIYERWRVFWIVDTSKNEACLKFVSSVQNSSWSPYLFRTGCGQVRETDERIANRYDERANSMEQLNQLSPNAGGRKRIDRRGKNDLSSSSLAHSHNLEFDQFNKNNRQRQITSRTFNLISRITIIFQHGQRKEASRWRSHSLEVSVSRLVDALILSSSSFVVIVHHTITRNSTTHYCVFDFFVLLSY